MFIQKLPITLNKIETFIIEWLNLLSKSEYDAVLAFTKLDEYYKWNSTLLENVISNYGFNSSEISGNYKVSFKFNIDIKSEINNKNIYIEIYEENNSIELGELSFNIPLNDVWSDLTANFTIIEVNNNFIFELKDIHVL